MKVDRQDAKKAKESKEQTRIYLRKLGDEAKASPEAKAKLEKAKARLDKLRAELNSKRKELAEAEHDLAKLSGSFSTFSFSVPEPKIVEIHGKPLTIEKRIVGRGEKAQAGGFTIGAGAVSLGNKDPRTPRGPREEAGRAARAGRDAEEAGPGREAVRQVIGTSVVPATAYQPRWSVVAGTTGREVPAPRQIRHLR